MTSFHKLLLPYKSIIWLYFCDCLLGRVSIFNFFYFVALSHLFLGFFSGFWGGVLERGRSASL